MGVLIWKTKVCTSTGYSLSSSKTLKKLKIWSNSIFENSKNQILNNCIINEKKGGWACSVNQPAYIVYTPHLTARFV